MVKPQIHCSLTKAMGMLQYICSSQDEPTQANTRQDEHVVRQQQDKEINCGAPCKHTSTVIHCCLVRRKATEVTVTVFNVTEAKLGSESMELNCR